MNIIHAFLQIKIMNSLKCIFIICLNKGMKNLIKQSKIQVILKNKDIILNFKN